MSYNSKYTGSEVESLLDKVANGGIQCYIAQTALYELLYDEGLIALPQNDMQGILDALTSRKLVLFPDALGIGTDTENNGYGVMLAGAAEDLLYFTVADSSGVVFAIEVNLDRTIVSRKEVGLTIYNTKTINGESLVGQGDITIEGGGSGSSAMPLVDHGTGDTTFELTPNVFHKWGEVHERLTLTLGAETAGVVNQYVFEFKTHAGTPTLVLPDSIKWANDAIPTLQIYHAYQISILNGLATVLSFPLDVPLFPNSLNVGDNGDTGIAIYDYFRATYGDVTNQAIEEPLDFDRNGLIFEVTSITYGTYVGSTGYWLNGYNSMGISAVLSSDGLVTLKYPIMPDE